MAFETAQSKPSNKRSQKRSQECDQKLYLYKAIVQFQRSQRPIKLPPKGINKLNLRKPQSLRARVNDLILQIVRNMFTFCSTEINNSMLLLQYSTVQCCNADTFFIPCSRKREIARLIQPWGLGKPTPLKFTNCRFTPKLGVKITTFSNEQTASCCVSEVKCVPF